MMTIPIHDITSNIQLALAPVFLLTAMVTLITAISGRLARAIDRMRFLHRELSAPDNLPEVIKNHYQIEFREVKMRGRLCTLAIFFDVLCGVLISLTVLELFFFQTGANQYMQTGYLIYTFVAGLVCFVISLLVVLAEVVYAYRSATWDLPIHPAKKN
jgi:uncharacterized membrane protein YcfT